MRIIIVVLLLWCLLPGCIAQPEEPPVAGNTTTNATQVQQPVQQMLNASNATAVLLNGTIDIGFVGPLSGKAANYGRIMHYAMQLAVEEINENGGINGAKLRMLSADGACSVLIAKNSAEGLIKTNDVQVILGGLCPEEAEGMDVVLRDRQVVLLTPSATGTYKTGEDFRFIIGGNAQAAAKKLSDYAEKMNWTRIAVINEDSEYPRTFGDALAKEFNSRGRIISSHQVLLPRDDVKTAVYSITVTGPQGIVIFTQSPARSAELMRESRKTMPDTQLMGGEIEVLPATAQLAKKDGQGVVGLRTVIEQNNTMARQFLDKYENRYGEKCPALWMAMAARDSIYIITGIMRDDGYTQNDGSVIRNELNRLKNWKGLSGNITFDLNGNAGLDYELVAVKDFSTELIN